MTNLPEALQIFQKSKELNQVEGAVTEVIINNYWQGVDRNVVIQALAAQKELGFGPVNTKRREEAMNAGLFKKVDEWTGEKFDPEGWYFLGSDLLMDLNDEGEVILAPEPVDKADEIEQAFEKAGLKQWTVKYLETDNWNDGRFNFSPVTKENPGVYRVWVHVPDQTTRGEIEKLISQPSPSYTGR